MNSFESQFLAIVGSEYDPRKHELPPESARALSAVIFAMPDTQIIRSGQYTDYAGWSQEQSTYLAVSVDSYDGRGYNAVGASENLMGK
ncbi:hypothetical protein G8E10_14230 [Rhizobiaceae bacterium CRRU44]|uniref:Uncharacterized protein n=1 Tax=Ferranicluibacter rubi TaxID=2715133 RepID=A0AA44CB67_9HYPH|nr:hypothetical protein [Ferranicluibacter rubi]NHT76895.1 hypothetical protein [Ferranicluibacter rubi]